MTWNKNQNIFIYLYANISTKGGIRAKSYENVTYNFIIQTYYRVCISLTYKNCINHCAPSSSFLAILFLISKVKPSFTERSLVAVYLGMYHFFVRLPYNYIYPLQRFCDIFSMFLKYIVTIDIMVQYDWHICMVNMKLWEIVTLMCLFVIA